MVDEKLEKEQLKQHCEIEQCLPYDSGNTLYSYEEEVKPKSLHYDKEARMWVDGCRKDNDMDLLLSSLFDEGGDSIEIEVESSAKTMENA